MCRWRGMLASADPSTSSGHRPVSVVLQGCLSSHQLLSYRNQLSCSPLSLQRATSSCLACPTPGRLSLSTSLFLLRPFDPVHHDKRKHLWSSAPLPLGSWTIFLLPQYQQARQIKCLPKVERVSKGKLVTRRTSWLAASQNRAVSSPHPPKKS